MKVNPYIIVLAFIMSFPDLSARGSSDFQEIQSAAGISSISELSVLQNPARLKHTNNNLIAVGYSPSKFGIPEISPAKVLLKYNLLSFMNAGLSVSGAGNQLYSDMTYGFHDAISIGDNVTAGVSCKYSVINIKDFPNRDLFQFDVGGLIKITDLLTAGFSLLNLTKASNSNSVRPINQTVLIGAGLNPLSGLFFDIDAIIVLNKASGVSVAGKYRINDLISTRVAVSNCPHSIEGGTEIIVYDGFGLSLLVNYHEDLGFSKYLTISYQW